MRIECENCSATYTIDDSQLSDAPIGAQCPYCGHVKLVQRGGAAPNYPMSNFSPTGYPATGAQSSMHGAGATGLQPSPTGPLPGSAGATGLSAAGAGATGGYGGMPASHYGPAPTGASQSFGIVNNSGDMISAGTGTPDINAQYASAPGGAPGFQSSFAAQSTGLTMPPSAGMQAPGYPQPSGATGDAPRFGTSSFDLSLSDDVRGPSHDLAVPGQVPVASAPSTCQVCGTTLHDEFDKVIGLCDEHQRDRRYGDGASAEPAPASGVGARWHARSPDGLVSGPMPLEELRVRIRDGSFSLNDDFSRDGVDFGPIARFKELAYLASLTGEAHGGRMSPARYYARGAGLQSTLSRILTPALLLLIIGGIGYLAFRERAQISKIAAGLMSTSGPTRPMGPNPLQRYKDRWALAHPDVSGTTAEHLVTARARHLEDTWSGYQQAERAFQRALLLDMEDADAVAGYAENLVIWQYPLLAPDELRVVEAAARYAMALEPQSPVAHRVLGAIAYQRRDLNGCRAGADAALQRDATDARAKLLLAECYMEGNVSLAIEEAQRAQRLLPALRRADMVLGRAYAKQGRFASAFQLLTNRLKVDPNNAAVHRLYGQVAREIGERKEARERFNRALKLGGDTQGSLLELAELALETKEHAAAVGYYRRLTQTKLFGKRGTRVYAGWARAELARRQGRRAVELAAQALQYSSRDPAALLIRGESALFVKSATTAALYAKQAESARLGEPAVLILAGRAMAAQNDHKAAIQKMQSAINNDPQDPRLKGVLAAEFLKQGGVAQAFTLMRRAADIDPQSVGSRSRVGLLALSPLAIQEAIDQFRRAAVDERNASVSNSAIGLLYYHSGERSRAKVAIERALRLDDANIMALIYQAQLALDRRDYVRAQKSARKLLAVERGSALGYLMLARATAARRQTKKAQDQYRLALRSDPGLLPAKVELAGLKLETAEREQAIQELQEAYLISPSSLTVRRLLLKAGI